MPRLILLLVIISIDTSEAFHCCFFIHIVVYTLLIIYMPKSRHLLVDEQLLCWVIYINKCYI